MQILQPELIPVIIAFRSRPTPRDSLSIIAQRGEIKYVYTIINAIAARIPRQAIYALRRNPNIEYIEMDDTVFMTDINQLYDTNQLYQPHYVNTLQQTIPWGIDKIGANTVYTYTKGTGIKIAIIDTGIDYNHPDLSLNYKGGYNFVYNNPDPMDDNGHGTHVTGIVAALDNNIGVIGVAPEAYIYAIKVLDSTGSGYISDVIAGIQWSIENLIKIINMSFGSIRSNKSLARAIDAAYKTGLLLVASAGNAGNVAGKGNNILYPARYDTVIAVAATDINNNRALWSSTGPSLELSAPGVNILSTLPGNRYGTLSGTSMASPHVAGVAALVMAYDPTLTNVQTRIKMQITADDLGPIGKDNLYGYGLVNAPRTILGP